MSLSPGTRLGAYEIAAAVGAGGMGAVCKARDTKLNRYVAIKVVADGFTHDPEWLARFRREAQILAALNHPNTAAIYGLEETEGVQFLVMELVEGETLADRLTHVTVTRHRAQVTKQACPSTRRWRLRGRWERRCRRRMRKASSTAI